MRSPFAVTEGRGDGMSGDLKVQGCGATLDASGALLSDGGTVPAGTIVTCAMPQHTGQHCGWCLGRLVSWSTGEIFAVATPTKPEGTP